MEPNTTPAKKGNSNLLLWILGGAGLLAAIVLLSSFKKTGTGSGTNTTKPPVADTGTDCATNKDCMKGFWKWFIIRYLYGYISKKATENGTTVAAQIDADAQWNIDNKTTPVPEYWDAWQNEVSTETTIVKAEFPDLTYDVARVRAIDNIITKLLR